MITFKIIGKIVIFNNHIQRCAATPWTITSRFSRKQMSWGCRKCFFFNFWMSWVFLNFASSLLLAITFLDTLYNSNCRFYLADKAVGAKGFKAIWTEIKVIIVLWKKCPKYAIPLFLGPGLLSKCCTWI